MKRLINNGDIFDKYASFEDKKFRDDTIKQFNWQGHRHISGTYSGAAYTTSLADGYMATNLRTDANPKGSILVEAKNYTDQKIKHIHYIKLTSDNAQVYFTYMSPKADPYTIESLISSLGPKPRICCSGYYGNLAIQYITSDGSTLTLGVFEPAKGKITPMTMTFNTINDYVD